MHRDLEEFDEPQVLLAISSALLAGKFAGTQHVFFSGEDLGRRVKEAVDGAQALIAEVKSRYPDTPVQTAAVQETPPAPLWDPPPPSPTPASAPPPASTSVPGSLESPTVSGSPTPETGQNATAPAAPAAAATPTTPDPALSPTGAAAAGLSAAEGGASTLA